MAKKRDVRVADYRPPGEMELVRLLDVRYPPPAWAFLPFVRNATGWTRQERTADGMAMSLWPSRGLEILGFEIKTHRGDWLRELKDPAKADEIFGYVDRWYVVAGDDTIVQKGELPATWGLIVKKGRGLRVQTEAPKVTPQKAIGKNLLAAILRRVQETKTPDAALKAKWTAGYDEGVKVGQEAVRYECGRHLKELAALNAAAKVFERVCGVSLYRYDWHGWDEAETINIAEAVRVVMKGQYMDHFNRLMALRDQFNAAAKVIDDAVEKARKTEEAKA